MDITLLDYVLAALAALAAGAVNALAGGGTLISFPTLTFIGVPAVAANITNTVALVPGYLGATYAQLDDLHGQRQRLWWYIPISVIGGLVGGLLLLYSGEKVFRSLVPYLILFASGLLAVSDPVRKWLMKRVGKDSSAIVFSVLPIGLAAVYGGYFGAGLSVIVLAVLGLVLNDSLTVLNALKQVIAFSVNIAAALFFIFSGEVVWSLALVMAIFALIGGNLGGRVAGSVKPSVLRLVVVVIGVAVSIIYLVR
jgi:uncharacterized membrane protein YfcA